MRLFFIGLCLVAAGCATQKVVLVEREPAFEMELPVGKKVVTCKVVEVWEGNYDCI